MRKYINENFDPQKHICKFIFQRYEYTGDNRLYQRITGNLYQNELTIELLSDTFHNVVETYGYKISQNMLNQLLPLLLWDDYEKYRDISGWNMKYDGYRDGWGYKLLCMGESGNSLLQFDLNVVFSNKNKPVYEKLLDFIIANFSDKKELRDKNLLW